jgi:hypothetical protein
VLDGVILLWFLLAALSVLFVGVDIRRTPEAPVMKWGFVIVTAFTGPAGAFLYVLGCREPLPGTHERYVDARWRQVLGSTLHCVAGDGLGILAAAVVSRSLHLPMGAELAAEYLTGFLFGWTVFQALFMRGMVGGSYGRSLAGTVVPEFLSMNGVMAGMVAVMVPAMARVPGAAAPDSPRFWFLMSMALLAGLIVTYPINWWLVGQGLKHGMMTVRPDGDPLPLAGGLRPALRAESGHAAGTAARGHHHEAHGGRGDEAHAPAGTRTRHPAGGGACPLVGAGAVTLGFLALALALAGVF